MGSAITMPGKDALAELMGIEIASLRDMAEHVKVSPEERAVLEQKAPNKKHSPYARAAVVISKAAVVTHKLTTYL